MAHPRSGRCRLTSQTTAIHRQTQSLRLLRSLGSPAAERCVKARAAVPPSGSAVALQDRGSSVPVGASTVADARAKCLTAGEPLGCASEAGLHPY